MGDQPVKIKVTQEGATQAAGQVDKLTASLQKMLKTQTMIAQTEKDLQRKNVIDAIKREAEAVNALSTAYTKQQSAIAGSSASVANLGNNTAQLRAKLGPAAALVGNFASSISSLAPQLMGVTGALQKATMGAGQMMGVLGSAAGGPVGIAVGLVSAVAALATYMSSAKEEADALAKATEANSKAMGSYLDQIQKLRSEVKSARAQKEEDQDIRSRILGNKATPKEIQDEIDAQNKRLDNTYYSKSYTLKDDFERQKREKEAQAIRATVQQYASRMNYARETEYAAAQNAKDKAGLGLDLGGSEVKEAGKAAGGRGFVSPEAIQKQLQQIDDLIAQSKGKVQAAELERVNKEYAESLTQAKTRADVEIAERQRVYDQETVMRNQERQAQARHMQELTAQRKMYQDIAVGGAQMLAGVSIKAFQEIAKGHKVQIGQVLEGLGDQIVAMGQGYIFKGIAESILLNPQGPALIGVGTAAVAFGAGLGAAGAHGAGGSSAGGGAGKESNPFTPGPRGNSNPYGPQENTQPQVINVYLPSVLTPTAEDGLRIRQALKSATNSYGPQV